MSLLKSLESLKQWRASVSVGQSVVLVPTMGALHDGHMALVKRAKAIGNKVVVSIFVNPLQFRPSEDFNQYPRPLEADLAKCEAVGVDAVFLPTDAQMYPEGRDPEALKTVTRVIPPASLIQQLCGQSRPGHFEGVATVVMKLFQLLQPTHAVFGEKDAQQLAVIQQMVRDLNIPVEIVPHPTVRNESGLALSSRNQYLDSHEKRSAALLLWRVLTAIAEQYQADSFQLQQQPAKAVLDHFYQKHLLDMGLAQADWVVLDYLEAVDKETFCPALHLDANAKVLMAVKIGEVRLIDNLDLTALACEPQSQSDNMPAETSSGALLV
jgi:pantoate--beta-alanine ligase